MPSASSFVAGSDRRIEAGGFDLLAAGAIFLLVGTLAEKLGFDLARWPTFGAVYFGYHFVYLVWRQGRTIGKTANDICVVSTAGESLTLVQSSLRAGVRAAPFALMGGPPLLAFGLLFLTALVLAELRLLERSPARRTIADRFANSLVVNLPPLQPHRAPAGPMFSAHDFEFGLPPNRPGREDHSRPSRSNPSIQGTPEKLRFSVPSLRSVAPDLERWAS
jgi:uncharacterized RDD family membrane protein YckC